MAIHGLSPVTIRDFRAGRMTAKNLTGFMPEHCLIAEDVFFLGDGNVRRRGGYTLVQNIGVGAQRLFDFHRQSDQKQYLIANYGTRLSLLKVDGSMQPRVLSSTEDATKPFSFGTNSYGLFGSNGVNSYAMYNVSGTETLRSWGIAARTTAPTIDTSVTGTLTLTYGRQYVYCDVIKWTDAQGVSYYHIGAPSPISAGTGPITDKVVTLGSMMNSSNPAVTHKWIFATTDQPADQSADFMFAAEIPNNVTSWGDSLPDDQLDYTRAAPWDNLMPPTAQWLIEYCGRIVALGIPSAPDSVWCSAVGEVDLGVQEESFPQEVRFSVPGGIKQITGGAAFSQSLMLSTPEFWFQIRGTDESSFTKTDFIIKPGAVGFKCVVTTQSQLIWLGPDKKLWCWDGSNLPLELSFKLAQPSLLPGVYSMNDLTDAQLANCELKIYDFGRYHFIVVGAYIDNSPYFTWLQLWDASALVSATGWRTYLSDGSTVGLAESDMFPNDDMIAMANVEVGNTQWLYLCDNVGNIFRWPDGFADNGALVQPQFGTGWIDQGMPGVVKHNLWADLTTDRDNADTTWTSISAAVSNGVNMKVVPQPLKCTSVPGPYGIDHSLVRASFNQQGCTIGQWLRLVINWPSDNLDATLSQIQISSKPLSQVNP